MQLIMRLQTGDERVLHFLVERRTALLTSAARLATHLGGFTATAAFIVAMLLGSDVWRGAGVRALVAVAVSHAIVQLLKRTVTRARPSLPVGFSALVETPDRFSFPSGHSAAVLAVALAAAPLAVPFSTLLVLAALAVGTTRCYLGVHFPGDVLAGWLIVAATYMVLF